MSKKSTAAEVIRVYIKVEAAKNSCREYRGCWITDTYSIARCCQISVNEFLLLLRWCVVELVFKIRGNFFHLLWTA